MQCDNCGKSEAIIHLTKIQNNEMNTYHLCESCAAAEGLETSGPPAAAPLTDFLAQMGKSLAGEPLSASASCSECGLTLSDFKRTGRLGCATCYAQWDHHLRGLLRRLHGATQHSGKVVTARDPQQTDRMSRVASLRRSLQLAVESEDFERAAALRDQIRRIESTEASAGRSER